MPIKFYQKPPRPLFIYFFHFESFLVQNLENQLAKRFSTEPKFWRTSCKVSYAGNAIELEIPHDMLREYGCEVHTDLGCMVSYFIAQI